MYNELDSITNINISVVIPAYNRKKTIKRCVDSVLNQTYPVFEIIVVDDGSTDGTLEAIRKEYGIKVMIIKQNHKGAQAARNAGIHASTGKYIVFLDSDDSLTTSSISDRIEVFESNPDIDMVYGDAVSRSIINKCDKIQNYNSRKYLLRELSLCPFSVMMVKREVFETIPLLDVQYKSWQDDDFIMQLELHNKKMYHCGKVVARMYSNEGQITSNYNNLYEGCKRIVNKYKRQIISEISYGRWILWKIRVLRDWLRKNSIGNKINNKIFKKLFVRVNKLCLKYFKHVWG